MKEFLWDIFMICSIFFIISFVWVSLEVILYGEVFPRLIDDYIATALTISIFFNMKGWKE